jgi:hypothetical protein
VKTRVDELKYRPNKKSRRRILRRDFFLASSWNSF